MDERIIDLDSDNLVLPEWFSELEEPINLLICGGDGEHDGVTDIEYFTTGVKTVVGRPPQKITIFMTTTTYNEDGLQRNKDYLKSKPTLRVLLLIYNHKEQFINNERKKQYLKDYEINMTEMNSYDINKYDIDSTGSKLSYFKYQKSLTQLFNRRIDNIYEDFACYAPTLDLITLYHILKPNIGTYHVTKKVFTNYSVTDIEENTTRIEKNSQTVAFIANLFLYYDKLESYYPYFEINLSGKDYYIKKNNKDIIAIDEFWHKYDVVRLFLEQYREYKTKKGEELHKQLSGKNPETGEEYQPGGRKKSRRHKRLHRRKSKRRQKRRI
jgi:hypothetical protein